MGGSEYIDPIAQRYASEEIQKLFSPRRRARVWRQLWIALAEIESEMGLPVSAEQVSEMRSAIDNIDLDRIAEIEADLRHDVMAHIHHFGEVAPGAKGVIHLGATSCFVTDNGDLLLIAEASSIVSERLLRAIHSLAEFVRTHAAIPTLGLTHLQPAQLTTVGKRAALWVQDLVDCWQDIEELRNNLPLRGVKGTTGTQASFLQLLGGDEEKVRALDLALAEKFGFSRTFPITGQTYPRSWDHRIISRLGELAAVLHKIATDIRLLQSWGEIEEPYGVNQVGSSAMPYKRNPMKSERICALARHLMAQAPAMGQLAATQWMERTLDDSAHRRVAIPQSFLTIDALLITARNIFDGLVVHPRVIERRVAEQLPFIAVEELLMEGVARGGDRQDLHERIRRLAWQAKEKLLEDGGDNPLRGLVENDDVLGPIAASQKPWESSRFTGLAESQARRYLADVVDRLPRPEEDHLRQLKV